MPKVAAIQTGFQAGEVSPTFYGAVDNERYKKALATCLNYIPTIQGPLLRRPGTKFVHNAKFGVTGSSVLIPFRFSATQNYILEFASQGTTLSSVIRFYTNGGILVGSTNILVNGYLDKPSTQFNFAASRPTTTPKSGEVIVSTNTIATQQPFELYHPYLNSDLGRLRWAQIADTMYLTHPSYPMMKLQRYDFNDWKMSQVYLQDGPYLALNSYARTGDSIKIGVGAGAVSGLTTITTGFGGSQAQALTITNAVNRGDGVIRLSVTGIGSSVVNGQHVRIDGIVGTVEANTSQANSANPGYWSAVIYAGSTSMDLIGTTFANNYISGGNVRPALFNSSDANRAMALIYPDGQRYWGVLGAYTADSAVMNWAIDPSNTLPNTGAQSFWKMGVFSGSSALFGIGIVGPQGIGNNPAIAAFHQDRLCLAGSPNFPQEIDGSYVAQYENFAGSVAQGSSAIQVTNANAFQFNLNSTEVNTLRWMKSATQGLLAGSYSNEWTVTPSTQAAALSATNVNAQQSSFFGSADIDAIQIGNATLYVQRAQKKVRELNFFFQVGTFRSTDLSELSDHITLPAITKLAVQNETYPLVWGVKSDGNLVSMSYARDDRSINTTFNAGWARHILGGQSDSGGTNPIVQSVASIPAADGSFDQLWMVVQRSTITGSSYCTIEYLTRPYDDSFLQEDAFQLDCGSTYDSPITLTGISTASAAIVTAANHGFANGNSIRVVGVAGMNSSVLDANNNVVTTNLVNENTYQVGSSLTNTFALLDFNGNGINSLTYGAYSSGGQVRKMVTTITGSSLIAGETYGVLADGAIHPDVVVSASSAITLNYAAAKVQIGYRYNSDGKLLRTEAGAADGTSIGKTRRTTRAAFQLHNVGDLSLGTSFTNLIPVQFPAADLQVADQRTPLFNGMIREGLESAYDFESQVCFRQNSPLPGLIQSVTLFMEEFDT